MACVEVDSHTAFDRRGHVGRRRGDDGSSPLYRGPRAVPRVPGARADDDALVAARPEPLAGRVDVGAGRVADNHYGGGRGVLDLRVGKGLLSTAR